MPDSKITALTSIGASTDPANDPLVLVDVSDTSMAATGTTKKVTLNQLLGASGTATLASATITGDLTVATSSLKVTGGNAGIGTATPNVNSNRTTLTLQGAWGGQIDINVGAINHAQFGTDNFSSGLSCRIQSADGIIFKGAAGAELMRLNSTGLGVGVASPAFKIHANGVIGTTNTFGAFTALQTAGGTGYRWTLANDNNFYLQYSPDGFGSTATSRITLDSSGNVGVGVTPSAWSSGGFIELINSRAISFAGTAGDYIANAFFDGSWKYKTTGAVSRYRQDTGQHIWSIAPSGTAGNSITFTQAMTLDASGNLLVGTTTAGGNRLNVQTASGDCLTLIKSQAANVNFAIDYVSNYGNHTIRKSGTAIWDFGVINDASATPAFKISNASAVGVQLVSGATAWTTLSDETLKDIIEPISNAIAKVGSLRSVIGKFKTDSEGTRRSFLIAQDVKSVLPEAVDVVGENNELGLRYTEVIPLLVAAIKELTARVQTLEAK